MTNLADQFKGMDIPGLTWGNMSTPEGQLLIKLHQVRGEKQHLTTHKLYLDSRLDMLGQMEQVCEQDLAKVREAIDKKPVLEVVGATNA